jgi:hypothetical protein
MPRKAFLAFVGFLVLVFGSTSTYAELNGSGRYKITSRFSGKALDVAGASTENGANIQVWSYGGGSNQQFDIEDIGNGYYSIRAAHSGKSIDVYRRCTEPGCRIVQWEYHGDGNQQWQITGIGDDHYEITSRYNGMPLDVWEWNWENGADVRQWDNTGGTNQQWAFERVSDGPGDNDNDFGDCGSGNPDATVEGSHGNYTATRGFDTVYSGSDYRSAIQAALDSLDPGRSSQQRVSVLASGAIGASSIRLPSHTSFEVCGTMDVANRRGRGAVEALDATNVSIPHLKMTGTPYFGLRFYGVNGLHLGQIRLELSGGLGIRFERDKAGSWNVTMDDIYVSGTDNHGVETWNIDGLDIGTVVARHTKYCGLLLNNTRNATIGTVDGDNVATGTGYATFRLANGAGQLSDGSYDTNITVDNVISRGGGRGFFCVSQSGGLRIHNVDLADNGNNAVLIENCYNVSIDNGTVNGGGEVRVAARNEFPNTRDVNITLIVNDTTVRERPCGDNVNWNISGNASVNVCD